MLCRPTWFRAEEGTQAGGKGGEEGEEEEQSTQTCQEEEGENGTPQTWWALECIVHATYAETTFVVIIVILS